MKSIKVIIISNNKVFRNNMLDIFKNYNTSVDIMTHNNSMYIFKYLGTKDFKLVIFKPELSFSLTDITKLGILENRGELIKILLFQKAHKNEVNTLNSETINYLKKNIAIFKTIKLDDFILDY